jgi:hypothetical protein
LKSIFYKDVAPTVLAFVPAGTFILADDLSIRIDAGMDAGLPLRHPNGTLAASKNAYAHLPRRERSRRQCQKSWRNRCR